jgi:hypothetical protein
MILVLALALTAQQPANPQVQSLYEAMGIKEPGLRGAELQAALDKAAAHPLGSEDNPVRAKGVAGERDYLARLRCADGKALEVLGRAVGKPSPFGGVSDVYALRCSGPSPSDSKVTFDMYHLHREKRPIPGFTLAR